MTYNGVHEFRSNWEVLRRKVYHRMDVNLKAICDTMPVYLGRPTKKNDKLEDHAWQC